MTRPMLVLALCGAVCARARAEPPPLVPPPAPLPPLSPMRARPEASLAPLRLDLGDLRRVESHARWKRNVGIGLAIPGVTLVVLGAVLMGTGSQNPLYATGAGQLAGGAVSAGVGVLFTIPGALLWVNGQDDLDLTGWRRRRLAPPP